jgi:putative transposase
MADLFRDKYRVPSARASWWDYNRDGAYFITICTQGRQHFFGEIEHGKMHLTAIGQIAHDRWHEMTQHFPFAHLNAFVVMPNHVHGIIIIDRYGMNDVETLHATSPSIDNTPQTPTDVETLHATSLPVDNTSQTPTNVETLHATSPSIDNTSQTPTNVETLHATSPPVDNTSQTPADVETVHATSLPIDNTSQTHDTETLHATSLPPKNEKMASISPGSGSLSTIVRSYKSAVSKQARTIHADFAWQTRFHDHIIRDVQNHEKIRYYILNNVQLWDKDKFNPLNQ